MMKTYVFRVEASFQALIKSFKKKKSFYYTMLFSSSDLEDFSKNLVILFSAYSAGFLIGSLIRKVGKNEIEIQGLKMREKTRHLIHDLERRENESELKK